MKIKEEVEGAFVELRSSESYVFIRTGPFILNALKIILAIKTTLKEEIKIQSGDINSKIQ